MANEIWVKAVTDGRDSKRINLVFVFDLAANSITQAAANAMAEAFAPTPSSRLPANLKVKMDTVDAAIATGLDSGAKVMEEITFIASDGMDEATILATARANYATHKAQLAAWYADKAQYWEHVGKNFAE